MTKIKTLKMLEEGKVKTTITIMIEFLNSIDPTKNIIDIKHITLFDFQQRLGHKIDTLGDDSLTVQERKYKAR